MRTAQAAGGLGRPPMGNPEVPTAQGLHRGAFAGGPDVETAVHTTGGLTGGRNRDHKMPGDSLSYPRYVTTAMVKVFHNGLVWAKDPRGHFEN